MKPKANYDKKVHILHIRFGKEKSVDSEVQGNLVVDYDKSGKIVNIEVMDFSLDEFLRVREFVHAGREIALARPRIP